MPNGHLQLPPILRTPRLELRPVAAADAAFLAALLNDPAWLRYIGDRGVRTVADAERYIEGRIWSQYAAHGFGMYIMELRGASRAIGTCGLVRREFLAGPDLGVALLPAWVGHGYATEGARAVIGHAERTLGIDPLYAIVRSENTRSVGMLERLRFTHQGPFAVPPEGTAVELYMRSGAGS
ncbi:MAG: GNAT family N-acetyltransferase [Gammaproteobacteria bacterium]|nr:GNAT family N-acetyltransferase [Gammaproteobacteria bacterium]